MDEAAVVRRDSEELGLTYPLDPQSAVKAAVRDVVAAAPALTADQRDRLGALLA